MSECICGTALEDLSEAFIDALDAERLDLAVSLYRRRRGELTPAEDAAVRELHAKARGAL